jgi:hypothetical protein
MNDLPSPPVPKNCDLSGFSFMPLDCIRLVQSDLCALSSGDEFKAAVVLWCRAWASVPSGSLTDDDRILAHLVGMNQVRWLKVRAMAMRGWYKASDGKLYHPVITEKVLEAWAHREKQRNRGKRGNEVRWGQQKESHGDPSAIAMGIAEGSSGDPLAIHKGSPNDRKGQGQGP